MFRLLLIVCLLAGSVLPIKATSPMSPAEAWAKFRLEKDLTLVNGPQIYETFAEQCRLPGVVEFGYPETKAMYDELSLAWKSHPEADKRKFTLILPKGTTIVGGLQKIAQQRQQRVIAHGNQCIMIPDSWPPMQRSYMGKGREPSADLEDLVRRRFNWSINLGEPAQDYLERFLTHRFELAWKSENKLAPCPYRVQASEAAREKLTNLNLSGTWTYEELLNATSYIIGLQWQLNGTTIQIDVRGL